MYKNVFVTNIAYLLSKAHRRALVLGNPMPSQTCQLDGYRNGNGDSNDNDANANDSATTTATRTTCPGCASQWWWWQTVALSLLLAFWKDLGCSKLIPKGSGTQVPDPVALSHPCCGKTRQSKRLLSILIVQSRISSNLLSSLFI